ncbi:MAG: putative zinc-binding protein [Ignavibacteria bacterium]
MDTTLKTNQTVVENQKEYEIIHLEKTKKVCVLCEKYSSSKAVKKDLIAVISCEGACLRGEVSRRIANKICFEELPKNTSRVCLGGAFTKDTGQRNMVRSAKRVISFEGCFIECASRMIKGVIPDLNPEVIIVDKYYTFDRNLFGINDVSEEELIKYTDEAISNFRELLHAD